MRLSKIICFGAALALAGAAAYAEPAPRRVVSINLCTDQLALMLAAPGQVVSVSAMAANPRASVMADMAAGLPANHARAEEIYLLKPDLVLAGQFSNRATVAMLRRLGIRVALFEPAYGLDDVGARLEQMGKALGRQDHAAQTRAAFEAQLAALRADPSTRPTAALYYANGYTSGDASLAGQILNAAGLDNIAQRLGHGAIGALPLEMLAMAQPDMVITGQPYPGASRSEAVLKHPVVTALKGKQGTETDRDWVCGTPYALRAVAALAKMRRDLEAAK